MIETFGLDPLRVGFLTAIHYLFAAIAMVFWGRHSDRTGERRWHIALPLMLAAAAFAGSAYSGPLIPTMVSLIVSGSMPHSAHSSRFQRRCLGGRAPPRAARSSIRWETRPGFAGPYVAGLLKQATGSFSAAFLFLAAALVLGGLMALCFNEPARRS